MPNKDLEAWASLVLSVAVALSAVALGIGQWWEHRTRPTGLQVPERKYFLLQDWRRAVGIVLLGLLAPGIYVGSRLPPFAIEPAHPGVASRDPIVEAPNPPASRHPNFRFLVVWLVVFAIISIVLGLALIDWISTRRYALRQRQALSRERLDIFRATRPHADSARDGPADDCAPDGL